MTLRQAMDRLFDDDYRPFRWMSGGQTMSRTMSRIMEVCEQ
jgi:hypothetical protein